MLIKHARLQGRNDTVDILINNGIMEKIDSEIMGYSQINDSIDLITYNSAKTLNIKHS